MLIILSKSYTIANRLSVDYIYSEAKVPAPVHHPNIETAWLSSLH